MDDERRLHQAFLDFGELTDDAARTAFLLRLQHEAPAVASRLQRLLQAAAVDDSFLEVPAARTCDGTDLASSVTGTGPQDAATKLLRWLDLSNGDHRFRHFELLRPIKAGVDSVLFEAFDTLVQRRVAVKCLLPSISDDPARLERILGEARSLAKIDDPHVLKVLTVLEQDGLVVILFPWIAGPSLAEYLAMKPTVDPMQELSLALGLARGVDAIHRAGIVHRDLKPANIVIDSSSGTAVIVDFGLAWSESGTDEPGALCGTPLYMAPETVRGGPPTSAADRFSLGSMLYEMFAGVAPFDDDSVDQVFRRILDTQPTDLRASRPELSESIVARIEGLLRKSSLERDDDLQPLIAAISVELQTRRSAGEAALSAEQNPSHHEIKRQSGRRGSMLVGLAIIAIPSLPLVAAAIGWNLGWFNKAAAPSSLPAIGTDRGDDGTGRSIARTDEAAGKQREGVTGTGDASVSRLPAAASLSTAPFSTATFSDDGSTPQLDIGLSPYDSDDRLLVSSFGLVRIDELDVARNRYWCPERAGEWGEVIYRLEAEVEPQQLRTALLRCEVHVL